MNRQGVAVIPTYLRDDSDWMLTKTCLESIQSTAPDCQIMVVDDHSPNALLRDTLDAFCAHRGITLSLKRENTGFSATVNVGLRHAIEIGADAILINADVEFFERGWYERAMAHEEAVVGALLVYPGGGIQHAGIYYSVITRNFDHIYRMAPMTLAAAQEERICPVTGAFQRIRLETLLSVGVYDEGFKMAYEDVDYCQRVFLAGQQCVYDPKIRAIHHETVFRGKGDPKHDKWHDDGLLYLHRKYAGVGFADYIPTLVTEFTG